MKKLLFAVTMLLILCTVFAGCETAEKPPEDTEDTAVETIEPEGNTTELEPEGTGGGLPAFDMDYEYVFDFYGISSEFTDLIDREKVDEWLSMGIHDKNYDHDWINIQNFIKYFDIPKEDFIVANTPPGVRPIYTDEQIEALYSDSYDKESFARLFRNHDAINIKGDIYTPRWILEHSLEEIRAVGITDEMLRIKFDEWFYRGWLKEDDAYYSRYCEQIKPKLEMLEVDAKYDLGFYGIHSDFRSIIGWKDYEEWVYQSGYYDGTVSLDEFNILEFIRHFDIPKGKFQSAAVAPPYRLGDGPYFTLEKVDILYSGDKNLIAETFMAPEAINVNGEIYTPRWIAAHSIEEIKAAGITKEVLQSKYDEWIDTEKFAEDSEVCIKTKALLDNFN